MDMETKLPVAEFFAGIGLMRMGLEKAGWKVVWANDIDSDKKQIYEGHFKGSKEQFSDTDVHNVDGTEVPSVALATASFPCTDLSVAGGRRGLNGNGSGAFWGFVQAIRGMGRRKPKLLLLENVTGFLTSNGGDDFKEACLALNELGYHLDPFIIDAERFVPQSRQRLFVVGSTKKPKNLQKDDSPSGLFGPCRPSKLVDFILWNPDIRWAIRDLPSPPKRKMAFESIIEDVPLNSTFWWSPERAAYLLNQMSNKHRKVANQMISGKKLSFGTVFRRVRNGKSMAELRTDGIAGCLRTPRGGSGRQILFTAGQGNYRVRLLTPNECARLMGARGYTLGSDLSLNKALFGFGDAVCVPVVQWIAKNYLTPIYQEMYAKAVKR